MRSSMRRNPNGFDMDWVRHNNWKGMNWIRQEKRLAIYLRDGLACVYCGVTVESGAVFSLDHLKPVKEGGTHHQTNLVTACLQCNRARGTRPVRLFAVYVAGYIGKGSKTAASIIHNINRTRRRKLDLDAAKALVAARGSAAQALAGIVFEKQTAEQEIA